MNYTTYLFDFDYTLADSSKGIVICFRNVLNRHKFFDVTDQEIKQTIGKTLEDSFSILTGITDKKLLFSFQEEYSKESSSHMNINTFLFPEAISMLTALKQRNVRIGIISTKHRYTILAFLEKQLLEEWFDIIIGVEEVEHPKPNPKGVLLAIEQLRAQKEQTLYIGDSLVDAETAKNAGIDFIGITSGTTTIEELQTYPHRKIIQSLSELLALR